MSEKRFTINLEDECIDDAEERIFISFLDRIDFYELCEFLNEQEQKIQRWKNLYELKDAEVTARVDALNKVCEYYTSEVLFKSDVDPNKAVKEVINRILNTEVKK